MKSSHRSPSKSPGKGPPQDHSHHHQQHQHQQQQQQQEPLQINFLTGNTEVTSGIIHLFRADKEVSGLENVQLTTVCIPAVPPHMTAADLLEFFALFQDSMVSLRLLRDAMPSRYIVLIRFNEPKNAREFHAQYNKKPFNLMEVSCCCCCLTD